MLRVPLVLLISIFELSAVANPIFFFGDSLTDSGNIYNATTYLSPGTLGLVPVTPASPPYYDGRFSNGPVWSEHVAAALGSPADADPAGMSLGIFGEIAGTGNNYAIGGARTGTGGALGGLLDQLVPTGVLSQVNYYLGGNAADPTATYFLLGGGNDLRDAAALTDETARFNATATAALNMISAVYSLYQAGGRNFVLLNAPNIGLIPESLSAGRFESGTLASMYFNYFLGVWAAQLGSLSNIDLQFVDVFSFYNELLSDVFQGGTLYGYTSITPCIHNQASCPNTIFFDDIHPTAGVHALLAELVLNQIAPPQPATMFSATSLDVQANPEPSTGLVLLGGLAGIAIRKHVTRRERRNRQLP